MIYSLESDAKYDSSDAITALQITCDNILVGSSPKSRTCNLNECLKLEFNPKLLIIIGVICKIIN